MLTQPLDRARMVRVGAMALVVAAGTGALVHNLSGPHYGYDFRGVLIAARAMLHGVTPYTGDTTRALAIQNNPYVLPPLLGELVTPLTLIPRDAAIAIFNVVCVAAMIGALWLLGLRDISIYVVVLFSLPFVDSLWLGQPDGLFALGLAVAWRYRRGWPAGIAIGCLIAAKLLFWPLLLWPLVSRRYSVSVVAAVSSVLLLVVTWALIGFHGLGGYPHRLALDGKAFDARSHSIAAAAIRVGTSASLADIVGIVLGAGIAAGLAKRSGLSDLGAFTAAIVLGLFTSPLMWTHYLVVLFVPLAVARRAFGAIWLLSVAMYLSPVEPVAHLWQILLVIVVGVALAVGAARRSEVPREVAIAR